MAQAVEHGQADLLARELRPFEAQGFLDLHADRLQLVVGDGAVLARGPQPGHDLGPVERLAVTTSLHDHQRGLF